MHRARWWELRLAQNMTASVYRCPLCDGRLPALSEHILLAPEGDRSRRRHAHTECVRDARRHGDLSTRDEWLATLPESPSVWERLKSRFRRGG